MPVATVSYNHDHQQSQQVHSSNDSLRSSNRAAPPTHSQLQSQSQAQSQTGYSPTSSVSANNATAYSPSKPNRSPSSATASPIDPSASAAGVAVGVAGGVGYPPPPPAREFLVNVEMWVATGHGGKGSGKLKAKSRSRPSSTLFSPSSSTRSGVTSSNTYNTHSTHPTHSTHNTIHSGYTAPPVSAASLAAASADDLSAAHSTSPHTNNPIVNAAQVAAAAAAFQSVAGGSKSMSILGGGTGSALSGGIGGSIFGGGGDGIAGVNGVWGSAGGAESGMWKSAVCKLSGEGAAGGYPSGGGGYGNGNGTGGPTGSALLTIYSSDDNTLQHVINIHKLTSTDVRPCDKSLFNRSDVLSLWGHPAAMSLSTTHSYQYPYSSATLATSPTSASTAMGMGMGMSGGMALSFSPIYLSFLSLEAHNTWLVLLRSYTSPEVYGRLLHPEQGGLYRMWRQVELVVVQSRGVSPNPANAIAAIVKREAVARETGNVGSTTGAGGVNGPANRGGAGKGGDSRPGTGGTTNNVDAVLPLGLVNSHTPSMGGSTGSSGGPISTANHHAGNPTGNNATGNSPTTPTTMTGSLKSWSTSSLPTSLDSASPSADPSNSHSHNQSHTRSHNNDTPSGSGARDKAKEKERKEREKEREKREKEKEKREKERKEREKKELKKSAVNSRSGFFAEIVLDGEVCGRTTVKRPPLPTGTAGGSGGGSTSTSSKSAGGSKGASTSAGAGGSKSSGATAGIAGVPTAALPTPEWFENFLFGDLPSFGNLLVMLWRAPERKEKEKEKDGERPRSAKGDTVSSTVTNTTSGGGGGGANSAPAGSAAIGSSIAPTSSIATGGAGVGGTTFNSFMHGGGGGGGASAGGVTAYGGAKGAVFLGCVEIALPNFRRGEWVEGWWPVYHHANQMTGSNSSSQSPGHGPGNFSGLGMGAGAMGLGGLSGVGGVGGALVQVGEMKLKIKVDEEIILPSRAYKDVLDALEQRNYLDVLSELEQKLRIDNSTIAPHIVSLAVARNRLLKDIIQLAEREVAALAGSTNTLFRGNTVLTKTMELAMAWYGRSFLDASVGPIIRRMIKEHVEIEVDPSRFRYTSLPSGSKRPSTRDSFRPSTRDSYRPGTKDSMMSDRTDVERDILQENGNRLLEHWCNELWNQMYVVRMDCPVELRRLFGHIRMMVERKFGGGGAGGGGGDPGAFGMLPRQAISSFVFLRFMVPAILNPHLFGLCPGMPSPGVARSLTLLAKCTQSLANLNPDAPPKEEYMRGISHCIKQNTVTMIDYLASVSSLPDQFSSSANTSSFLSGPDKHDRLHVIHSLRERLTGAGNAIPTLYKDAIPLLPYALDVPKHLAILSSSVVRNARTGTGVAQYGTRGGVPASDVDGWTLGRFSELCFDVEAQALKSVATLAQGAASAGAFNGSKANRSRSLSSTGGYNQSGSTVHPPGQQNSNLSATSGSRGVTPTAPASATTPTQTTQGPWNAQMCRPTSSRSITTPTGPVSAASPGQGNPTAPLSPANAFPLPTSKPSISLAIPASPKKRRSARPSTAPSSTSVARNSNDDPSYMRNPGPEKSPGGVSFRYLPPDPSDPRRPEDVALPETPITPQLSEYNTRHAHAPGSGYQTIHRAESESFVAFHYPTAASRFQNSNEALKSAGAERTEKRERRASRIKDFMKRPSTSSGAISSQRPKWGDHSPHSSSGEELGVSHSRKKGSQGVASLGASSGEGYSPAGKRGDRGDASGSGGSEPKKKKSFFGWLGGKK